MGVVGLNCGLGVLPMRKAPVLLLRKSGLPVCAQTAGVREQAFRLLSADDLQFKGRGKSGRSPVVYAEASSIGSGEDPTATPSKWFSWRLGLLLAVAATGLYVIGHTSAIAGFHAKVMASWLGQSGFVAALSLIFLSEIFDKTFFIAALLAMKLGRWVAFMGTAIALTITSILSVGMGMMFNAVPDAFKQTAHLGEYLGAGLLVFFGLRSLHSAWATKAASSDTEGGDELADAEETVRQAEESGRVVTKNSLKAFFEVLSLIFVGEWGDRSMMTTIALGASQNPFGVAVGATVAHIIAAALAVVGGSLLGEYVSERKISIVSGSLFLVIGLATIAGVL